MWRATRLTLLAAVLWVASSLGAPLIAAADSPSDIPGIPLPGPTALGLLGGPVYDVVYRLDVQPGYVIVAGLAGTAGTDFDLYLFDSSATTVVSNVGLVAKSTGSASTEHITYPSAYGGTFYLDLNGASDVEGTYTLTVQAVKDSTVPTASLLLSDGRFATDSPTVDVTLTAGGSLSGVSQMAFSPDGVAFGAWQPYTVASTWTFPAGDGTKALWAKVRNGVGTESTAVSASIVLDTLPPTANVIMPTPNSTVASLRPTFGVGFTEPLQPASWVDHGLVVQAASGDVVAGSYSYDERAWKGTFVPSSDLVAGAPYVVTIGAVRDVAGNTIAPPGSWLVTPLLPTELTLSGGSRPVAPGAVVPLAARALGAPISMAVMESRPAGSSTFAAGGPVTLAAGAATTVVRPMVNTAYRLSYSGNATAAAATSNEVTVLVRRAVALLGVSQLASRTVATGARVSLTAQVTPVGPRARLSFRLYRYTSSVRAYVYAGSFGRSTDVSGRASVSWTPSAGTYYWRVVVLSSLEYANNVSPVYRWNVVR
jgi:hypothetical protein